MEARLNAQQAIAKPKCWAVTVDLLLDADGAAACHS